MLNRIVARIGAVYVYVTTMLSMTRAAQANHDTRCTRQHAAHAHRRINYSTHCRAREIQNGKRRIPSVSGSGLVLPYVLLNGHQAAHAYSAAHCAAQSNHAGQTYCLFQAPTVYSRLSADRTQIAYPTSFAASRVCPRIQASYHAQGRLAALRPQP